MKQLTEKSFIDICAQVYINQGNGSARRMSKYFDTSNVLEWIDIRANEIAKLAVELVTAQLDASDKLNKV